MPNIREAIELYLETVTSKERDSLLRGAILITSIEVSL